MGFFHRQGELSSDSSFESCESEEGTLVVERTFLHIKLVDRSAARRSLSDGAKPRKSPIFPDALASHLALAKSKAPWHHRGENTTPGKHRNQHNVLQPFGATSAPCTPAHRTKEPSFNVDRPQRHSPLQLKGDDLQFPALWQPHGPKQCEGPLDEQEQYLRMKLLEAHEIRSRQQQHQQQYQQMKLVQCCAAVVPAEEERTTLRLCNLPNRWSRERLIQLLDEEGFCDGYDFVYLPKDFKSSGALGYAFVNFASNTTAERAKQRLQGFSSWGDVNTPKVLEASWSVEQGLTAHIERYRNSDVMHDSVHEDFKPVVFANGERQPFPSPSRRIRRPRAKRGGPIHCM